MTLKFVFTHLNLQGPIITAFYALGKDLMNEWTIGPGCWIVDPSCTLDESKDCLAERVAWVVTAYPILIMLLVIACNNAVILWKVRRTFRASRHHVTSDAQLARQRAVAVQAFLYVAAFLFPWVWSVTLRIASMGRDEEDEGTLYHLILCQAIFAPLQGVFNLLVAIHPKYMTVRHDYPLESRFWCFRRALYGDSVAQVYSGFQPRLNGERTFAEGLSDGDLLVGSTSSLSPTKFRKGSLYGRTAEPGSLKFDQAQDFEA